MNPRTHSRAPKAKGQQRIKVVDRGAANKNVREKRDIETPTHVGVKRYFTENSMQFLRASVRKAIDAETKANRLPKSDDKGERLVLSRSLHSDILPSMPVSRDYAYGLIDSVKLMKLTAEQNRKDTPPPIPVIATVKGIKVFNKKIVRMEIQSEELSEERLRLAHYLGEKGVKGLGNISEDDPIYVVLARSKYNLTPGEQQDFPIALDLAMSRLREDSPQNPVTLELEPWRFTSALDRAARV